MSIVIEISGNEFQFSVFLTCCWNKTTMSWASCCHREKLDLHTQHTHSDATMRICLHISKLEVWFSYLPAEVDEADLISSLLWMLVATATEINRFKFLLLPVLTVDLVSLRRVTSTRNSTRYSSYTKCWTHCQQPSTSRPPWKRKQQQTSKKGSWPQLDASRDHGAGSSKTRHVSWGNGGNRRTRFNDSWQYEVDADFTRGDARWFFSVLAWWPGLQDEMEPNSSRL